MQHEVPLHSTSLTKWRHRVGAEKLAELLQETISIAVKKKRGTPQEFAQVNVDTTVREKNITYPTDSKLYYVAISKLAKAAKNRGVRLRQTYIRVSRQAAIMVSRYAHAKQFQWMRRKRKKLKTWLGRVLRDLRRQVTAPDAEVLPERPLRRRHQRYTRRRGESFETAASVCARADFLARVCVFRGLDKEE